MTKLNSRPTKAKNCIPRSKSVPTSKQTGSRLPDNFYEIVNSDGSSKLDGLKGSNWPSRGKSQGPIGYLDLLREAAQKIDTSRTESPRSDSSEGTDADRPCPVKKIPKAALRRKPNASQTEEERKIDLARILSRAHAVVSDGDSEKKSGMDMSARQIQALGVASLNAQVERLIITHMNRRRMFWYQIYQGSKARGPLHSSRAA